MARRKSERAAPDEQPFSEETEAAIADVFDVEGVDVVAVREARRLGIPWKTILGLLIPQPVPGHALKAVTEALKMPPPDEEPPESIPEE